MGIQHVGIVACSAEGAALCYRTICSEAAEFMGPDNHPEVSMNTLPFVHHVECMRADDWHGIADQLVCSAEKLARIGADFLICPDNTAHRAMPFVADRLPLPWLHIADAVASEAITRGFRRVGLTGTKALVESEVYPERLTQAGISFARPDLEDRLRLDEIVFSELVRGVINPSSLLQLGKICERLKAKGCDSVVLGCTELPLLVGETVLPLPALDSTRLLARAAIRRAIHRD